jgi:hypothetical protein
MTFTKDVAAAAVTLENCIQEVTGSDLSPVAGYPDCGFSLFSSVSPSTCQVSTLKKAINSSFQILA